MNSLSQPQAAASSLGDGAFEKKAAPAASIRPAKHGERECEHCAYYDPKRQRKGKDWPCSPFGQLQNKDKDCSLYHEDMTPVEERVKWS